MTAVLAPFTSTKHKKANIISPQPQHNTKTSNLLFHNQFHELPAMSSSLTKALLVIFLIFSYVFLGCAQNFDDSESLSFSPDEFQLKTKYSRKLIGVDHALLDYEPPGANPSHEPKKGGGGKGG